MLNSQTTQSSPTLFWQRHGAKLAALLFWLVVVGGYYWYLRQNDLTLADSLTRLADLMLNSLYGPLLYIVLYALRPLLFFPATLLTLLGGFLFGPVGILYTIVGSNTSAMVAFAVGHYFGQGILENKENAGTIQRYTQRMRENSFETVLIMRLIFLPYDLVNYAAGFLKINWKAFLAATAIGSVPGTISIVLLGASFGTLNELLAGDIKLNPAAIITSVLLIIVSIGLSRYIKQREAQGDAVD
ncbi:MAG: TVP38/TMEM64 family protein [Chloroflexi bacterium]|jgi:uncharacterized membrane protein YdjX (TVP38/TMEM64 family)|nr:TVP38/TMEM64 family protein [Chloroflexota bacterium]MBK7917930.1 TVP38/TMEM64 family protein [Chloroflexota bacterium]MBK8935481.1 TVP38/TMEM64 family protein [Chloroflexota bacterium]MBP6805918.1 TVP38/TMEM64 family protein [Chloroflexota bacterium]MBP7593015.1 TVP38/TMEM64 family protein [Chloroflexota bacterium]